MTFLRNSGALVGVYEERVAVGGFDGWEDAFRFGAPFGGADATLLLRVFRLGIAPDPIVSGFWTVDGRDAGV